jgi:transposase
MARHQKEPLRLLSSEEHAELTRISRSESAPAGQVARARALLAVAAGQRFTDAAGAGGRRSGDGVAQLVVRFNRWGLRALQHQWRGGPPRQYGTAEQARILAEVQRPPEREADGTASWSLVTLQRALRRAPDGLPHVSTQTIFAVLHEAGYTYQRDRSWCPTGTAQRKRKRGTVEVHDPDAVGKKT